MSTAVTVNGSALTAPGPGRDTTWGANATALLVALATNSGRDFSKAVFFDKNGSSGNSGLTPAKGMATIAQAVTKATALSPTVNNPISIICLDGGIYTEDFSLATGMHLIAPAATISGTVTIADNASINVFELKDSGGTCITKAAGSGAAFIVAQRIADATGTGIDCDSGTMNVLATVISCLTAADAAASTTININCVSLSGGQSGAGTINTSGATVDLTPYLRKDGTVVMTGDLDLGGNNLLNVGSASLDIKTDGNGIYTE